jgi:hypothetical protein
MVGHNFNNATLKTIQGVSEIRLLILTSGKSRQFTFLYNILQNSQNLYKISCPPIFTKRVVLCE